MNRGAAEYLPASCGELTAPGAHATGDQLADAGCTPAALEAACQDCRGCGRYEHATQAVFGAGDPHARVMIVGEVPGNEEDLLGEPFVGPSGALLDDVLREAGLSRQSVWLTNAVKHFGFEQRGARRLHVKPTWGQTMACRPWLDAEIVLVEPLVVVALGSTAAQSLGGKEFRITRERGVWHEAAGRKMLASWHPSAVLRAPEREDRHRMRAELLGDLQAAARAAR